MYNWDQMKTEKLQSDLLVIFIICYCHNYIHFK